jgi:CheY-like chemotaxis protein
LLAGRKLLLADDSITIQKVVALTFADEGVEVVSVSNGRDAIDRLPEFRPDIVLADVFMPQVSGYEVCEFIKQNAQLRHIPVMLLVGSFEPFDEAEARRVGANETLTKPFQSIRSLIDKVGALVSGRPAEEQIPTAELPKPDVEEPEGRPEPEPERLSEQEIDLVTADTQPLPIELRHMVEESASRSASQEKVQPQTQAKVDEAPMEAETTQTGSDVPERRVYERAGMSNFGGPIEADAAVDTPLDLAGLETGATSEPTDFVLDIDLDEAPDTSLSQPSAYVRPLSSQFMGRDQNITSAGSDADVATAEQLARTQEFPAFIGEAARELKSEADVPAIASAAESKLFDGGTQSATNVALEGFPSEVIDAIARRAVEQLSEKVVREIAWDVVPDLAELLIKRQLEEEKKS